MTTTIGNITVVHYSLGWQTVFVGTEYLWQGPVRWGGASVMFCPDAVPGPPPSDTLVALIREFHHKQALAPLVDKLCEEYPQLTDRLLTAYHGAPVTPEPQPEAEPLPSCRPR